jgi:hypothetical protein
MPLFFASNALYPIALMPGWLSALAQVNPLTYEVDAIRALVLAGGNSNLGRVVDFTAVIALRVRAGGRLSPRVPGHPLSAALQTRCVPGALHLKSAMHLWSGSNFQMPSQKHG